ncbi:hypothetical protein QQS21_004810 [Conoideocrella luteorostrata]|uniref:DUF7068 domain-containing protein n=1 Tax=Conoideocrella luteorostrata TaxID=1105319 RepID=A0AAJ0CTP8_9HYPO|nr:hypothetical protein QQS21_004810 [Conoideocrella luteorostrata]
MVYDFVHANRWKELFDRVLWVPFRRLKIQLIEGWNLEDLFYHEYFHQHSDYHSLAKQLWQELDGTKGRRTLFILDGLDAVSREWNHDNYRSRFLLQLLNQPNKTFIHLETPQTNPKTVDEIHSFLQNHWLIQGLVRILIQLDALCYTWDELKAEDELNTISSTYKVMDPKSRSVPDTMTGMYKLIELKLWKKDVLRLEKKHFDKELVNDEIRMASKQNVERLVKDGMEFIESLAFTGLQSDVIDFTSQHLDEISDCFPPSLLLDNTLPYLSFLRTSDRSSKYCNQNYHFIHLTFQEYFAARYYVWQWLDQEGQLQFLTLNYKEIKIMTSIPAGFLCENKYTARYDVFWHFAADLLDSAGQANLLIDSIEKEPLDLLGPTHQRLIMYCMSEISSDLPFRKHWEAKLSQWLLFELSSTGISGLARES